VLNLLAGLFILSLLLASIAAPGFFFRAMGVPAGADGPRMAIGMRAIMVLGIAAVPVMHVILRRLVAIVDTVRAGDPFIGVNAVRLRFIAWAVAGLEVLHLAVGAAAAMGSSRAARLDIGWGLSPTRWLVVLLLFVLANVFEQGTRMREDLEGVV
jgi:hypothetical protein